MQEEAVNKKCIESLIKAGAFDSFSETRSTLMASFEDIIDTINGSSSKSMQGQVSMFDMGGNNDDSENELEKLKYNYTTLKEYTDQELLSMEKEMLGIYISGHPLEKYREQILKQANINTLQIKEYSELSQMENENLEMIDNRGTSGTLQDGQFVKFVGNYNFGKEKIYKK